mmetsp:Transcript_3299/g.5994  ORF Transcript_3299/g.5994 Transcript_3299/m.5994 type:complete len:263 (-) Transcript_3299:245-1033(-)
MIINYVVCCDAEWQGTGHFLFPRSVRRLVTFRSEKIMRNAAMATSSPYTSSSDHSPSSPTIYLALAALPRSLPDRDTALASLGPGSFIRPPSSIYSSSSWCCWCCSALCGARLAAGRWPSARMTAIWMFSSVIGSRVNISEICTTPCVEAHPAQMTTSSAVPSSPSSLSTGICSTELNRHDRRPSHPPAGKLPPFVSKTTSASASLPPSSSRTVTCSPDTYRSWDLSSCSKLLPLNTLTRPSSECTALFFIITVPGVKDLSQ